jgi:hypothetical protein
MLAGWSRASVRWAGGVVLALGVVSRARRRGRIGAWGFAGSRRSGSLGTGCDVQVQGVLLPLEQVMLLRVRTGGFWSMGFCLILRPTGGCEGGWVTVYGC